MGEYQELYEMLRRKLEMEQDAEKAVRISKEMRTLICRREPELKPERKTGWKGYCVSAAVSVAAALLTLWAAGAL